MESPFSSHRLVIFLVFGAVTLVTSLWEWWRTRQARAVRLQRESALIQALDDATRTGSVTLAHLQRLAMHHLVPADRLESLVDGLYRHAIGHGDRYGPRVEGDLLQLLAALKADRRVPELPEPLASAVKNIRQALPERSDLILALVGAGCAVALQHREQAESQRRALLRWRVATAVLLAALVGLTVWEAAGRPTWSQMQSATAPAPLSATANLAQ